MVQATGGLFLFRGQKTEDRKRKTEKGGQKISYLDDIHREEILERARRRRDLASRQPPAVVDSAAPKVRSVPKLAINDSASKERARQRGAGKVRGRTRSVNPAVDGRKSEAAKARMARLHLDPVLLAKRNAAIRASWTPERRKAAGEALMAQRRKPEVEAKRIASLKATVKKRQYTPEWRARLAAAGKRRIADPDFRKKFTAAGARNLAAYNARRKAGG